MLARRRGAAARGRRRGACPRRPIDVARTIEEVLDDGAARHRARARAVRAERVVGRAAPLPRAERRHASTRPPSACSRRRSRGASWSCSSAAWTRGWRRFEATRDADARGLPRRLRACCAPARRVVERAAAGADGPSGSPSAPRGARGAARLPARAAAPAARARLAGDGLRRPAASRPPRDRARGCATACRCSPRRTRPSTRCSPRADVVVAASQGAGARARACSCARSPPAPCRSPRTSPAYEEVVDDGEAGPAVRPRRRRRRSPPSSSASSRDAALRARLRDAPQPLRGELDWARVARSVEAVYDAARRAPPRRPRRPRGAPRGWPSAPLIDVDLHMHTDHSHDCATPVEVLLATARDRGPRRDRGHRPQRDLRRARGARARPPSTASR